MPEQKIRRKFKALPITLTTSTSSATTLRWDDVAGGAILMGTVSTNASSLVLWASGTTDGSFGRLYTSGGATTDIVLAPSATEPRVYAIPDQAYGVGSLKIVASNTHATAATCVVMLKT